MSDNSPYVLVSTDATLPNARVLAAGTGIALQDTGPKSTLTVQPIGNLGAITGLSSPGYVAYDPTLQSFTGQSLQGSESIKIQNPKGTTGPTSFEVIPNTTQQLVNIRQAGVPLSIRSVLNLISGMGVNISVVDNPSTASADVTISAQQSSTTWAYVFLDPSVTQQTLAPQVCYIPTSSSQVTFTLPTSGMPQGSLVQIVGYGSTSGGWSIQQNTGQSIVVGNQQVTAGSSGKLTSTTHTDTITLLCLEDNMRFTALPFVGNLMLS